MKFVYTSKDMAVSESLKSRVEKKLAKMERYFREEPEATVRFKVQKGARNIVEITVNAGGVILRAEESSNDMYLSIDRAVDKLESQLRRHRTKLEKRIRTSELEPVVEAPVYEEQSYDIVRTKKFSVKPMGIEDAITQMELLGHDFFLFLNEESETMNVLYRRNDGSYGLLQPDI
ncbi:MAG: ribosome-associated translation inhibitor RaiA [Clostridia bacterium]|nr:ribosome-associated translation inhibitor RaiA [Clostridia bacterium]MBP3653767.1 ribosome-associated translation inhibitor RaiA [Clostridia bacterium]